MCRFSKSTRSIRDYKQTQVWEDFISGSLGIAHIEEKVNSPATSYFTDQYKLQAIEEYFE